VRDIQGSRQPTGTPSWLGVAPTAVTLEYRLDERVPLIGNVPYCHVERWHVAALDGSASSDVLPVDIGYAHVLIFNLEPGDDIRDYADRRSGTWVDNGGGGRRRGLAGEPDEDDGGQATHVLVLDRVWLRTEWRGHGLGPIIAAAVIERLGRGCHVAACYPAPFENPSQDADERQLSIEALGRLWSKVGFTHWRDGVWMLDLNTDDRHAAIETLLAARQPAGRPAADSPPRILRPKGVGLP